MRGGCGRRPQPRQGADSSQLGLAGARGRRPIGVKLALASLVQLAGWMPDVSQGVSGLIQLEAS